MDSFYNLLGTGHAPKVSQAFIYNMSLKETFYQEVHNMTLKDQKSCSRTERDHEELGRDSMVRKRVKPFQDTLNLYYEVEQKMRNKQSKSNYESLCLSPVRGSRPHVWAGPRGHWLRTGLHNTKERRDY
ncbi:hypothetical protein EYF80_058825 [Liparis tanakae]|uniref:Uncharacterized protein n=1 Tax=Liparis tanakae TaxID=230148 RepID=A0A4Z2EQF8_9TELE|nr:hypothetical protein EYF80_058825 [Liparis tanakae]